MLAKLYLHASVSGSFLVYHKVELHNMVNTSLLLPILSNIVSMTYYRVSRNDHFYIRNVVFFEKTMNS